MTSSDEQPEQLASQSNPPRATDAEDERWAGEGGGVQPSAHGAGNDERDQVGYRARFYDEDSIPSLTTALKHLAALREGFAAGAVIHAASGLTADDIDLILDRGQRDAAKSALTARHGPEDWDSPVGS